MLDACHFMLATLVVWECPPTNVFFMAPWSLITKQKFKCYLAQGITEGKTLSSKHCSPVSTQVSWLVASHRITIVCGIQSSGMASSAGMECKYCMWSWNWSTKLPCDAAMQFDQRSCGSRTGNGTIICKAVTLPDFLFFSRWDGGGLWRWSFVKWCSGELYLFEWIVLATCNSGSWLPLLSQWLLACFRESFTLSCVLPCFMWLLCHYITGCTGVCTSALWSKPGS